MGRPRSTSGERSAAAQLLARARRAGGDDEQAPRPHRRLRARYGDLHRVALPVAVPGARARSRGGSSPSARARSSGRRRPRSPPPAARRRAPGRPGHRGLPPRPRGPPGSGDRRVRDRRIGRGGVEEQDEEGHLGPRSGRPRGRAARPPTRSRGLPRSGRPSSGPRCARGSRASPGARPGSTGTSSRYSW